MRTFALLLLACSGRDAPDDSVTTLPSDDSATEDSATEDSATEDSATEDSNGDDSAPPEPGVPVTEIASAVVTGNEVNQLGYAVDFVGDVDGDGAPDAALGSPDGYSNAVPNWPGELFLASGPMSGEAPITKVDGRRVLGSVSGSKFGHHARDLGDQDANGTDDLAITAHLAAMVHVFLGPLVGPLTANDAEGTITGAMGSKFGYALDAADLDADGITELVVGAPYDDDEAGGAYLWYGLVTGPLTVDDAAAHISGTGLLGDCLAFVPDLDGDGVEDLTVAARDGGSALGGAVYVFFDPPSGEVVAATQADVTLEASAAFHELCATAGGDIDQDGTIDLALGGIGAGEGGAVSIFYGPLSDATTADADATIEGTGAAGGFVGVGEIDGDGFHDVAVGDVLAGETWLYGGRVFVGHGPLSGILSTNDLDVVIDGTATEAQFAWSAAMRDHDLDGLSDLLVGEPHTPGDGGAAYLVLGSQLP